jgi:hypothetical protein
MSRNSNATSVAASATPLVHKAAWSIRKPYFSLLRHLRRRNVGKDDDDGPWEWSSVKKVSGSSVSGAAVSDLIRSRLLDEKPFMAARFGNSEIDTIIPYHLRTHGNILKKSGDFVRGEIPYFWWEYNTLNRIARDSGFFPLDKRCLERFCRLMLDDIKELDVLVCWLNKELYLAELMPNVIRIPFNDFFPVNHPAPWTSALKGKWFWLSIPLPKRLSLSIKTIEIDCLRIQKCFRNLN